MPRTSSSIEYSQLIGEVIRKRRNEVGLTQVELGERLGASQSYINRLEAGRINITIGQLGRVCEALGATLRVRLDTGEDDPLLARMAAAGRGRASAGR